MPTFTQEYQFTTMVTANEDPNEFIIEFTPVDTSTESVNVIKNFDELIEFLETLED